MYDTYLLTIHPLIRHQCFYDYVRYGLSSCINGSTLLNFMSCWVRFIGTALFLKSSPTVAYSIVLFGHCLAALGAPMIGNAPTRLANDWFPEHERDLAVSIMTQGQWSVFRC